MAFDEMELCKLCVPSLVFSEKKWVVQALNKGQSDCIGVGHIDADLWVLSGVR